MITIITPSYNRGKALNILYKSLLDQTSNNFEWLIVDDGSTDDTAEIVQNFINDKNISIRYIKKTNGGKHTALNVGIHNVDTELIFIVDSDDYLPNDAIEIIYRYVEKYEEIVKRRRIAGFSFLRAYEDGRINGKEFALEDFVGNHIDVRVNNKDDASDKAEVFFTDCLKKYPFPEVKGERFLGEDVVWMRIAREYDMVFVNKVVYIAEYLSDGLTRNRRKNNIKSPNGCVLRAKEYMYPDINIRVREKSTLQYLIYGWFAGKTTRCLIAGTEYKLLTLVNIIPAKLLYIKWKKEFEENN